MAIQLQGNAGTVAEVDGTAFRALRCVQRPVDHGTLGHYKYGGFTGIMAAGLAANSEIFQFRWVDATRLALITKVKISTSVSTTFFAAGVPTQVDLVKATGWTGQGTLGASVATSATLKARTSMGSSLIGAGDMRISTTAALGAGTKTLEANSMSALAAYAPTASASMSGQMIPPATVMWEPDIADGEHPLTLVQNEGFVIRSVAVPATGTWTAAIQIQWAELTAF